MILSIRKCQTLCSVLPARLSHSRDLSLGSKLSKGNSRHFKSSKKSMPPTSNLTAIHNSSWASISWKH